MANSVSIIIPNYNKADFLKETLDSVLAQTSKDWEAIVVDDGSTDQSKVILDEYKTIEKRIHVHYLEGGHGGSFCRNYGLSKARHSYVIFLDADDLLSNNCIENRVKILMDNPTLDFAVFAMGTFFSELYDNEFEWIPRSNKAFGRFVSHDLPWAICQPIWRKSYLEKNHLIFDERYSRLQDVEFHTKVLLKTVKFEAFPQILDCFYRIELKRHDFGNIEFLSRWLYSSKLYVNDFSKFSNKELMEKFWIETLSQLLVRKNKKVISTNELKSLILKHELIEELKHYWIARWYFKIGMFLPFNVRGLKMIFKLFSRV